MKEPELLDERQVYPGRVVDLRVETVRLPNGATCDLEIVRHPGAAAVLPLFADGTTLLLRQYRHASGGFLLEVPAGKLEHGEDPALCARRELVEETGWSCEELRESGWIYTTPGFTDEKIWLYYAVGLEAGAADPEEDEVIETVRLPLEDAVRMARSGEITDAKTICLLLRASPR